MTDLSPKGRRVQRAVFKAIMAHLATLDDYWAAEVTVEPSEDEEINEGFIEPLMARVWLASDQMEYDFTAYCDAMSESTPNLVDHMMTQLWPEVALAHIPTTHGGKVWVRLTLFPNAPTVIGWLDNERDNEALGSELVKRGAPDDAATVPLTLQGDAIDDGLADLGVDRDDLASWPTKHLVEWEVFRALCGYNIG